jgi:chloramphenicol-sensitive protein RarD
VKKGPIYVLLCHISWGLLPIFWNLLDRLNPLYILASRVIWALVFCTLLIVFSKDYKTIKCILKNKKELLLLGACGILVTVNWGSYIWAVNSNKILDASLAYYINPILSVVAGALFFKEKLSKLQWLSAAIAFTGVMISIVRYGTIPYMALIIGGSFAVYGALKKLVKADSKTSLFIETLTVFPLALIYVIYVEAMGLGSTGVLSGWACILLPMTGVVTGIPLLLYAKGIKGTSYSLSGILMYINPTLQLLIGVLLYHEPFTNTQAVTFSFVWAGLILYLISYYKIHLKAAGVPKEANASNVNLS